MTQRNVLEYFNKLLSFIMRVPATAESIFENTLAHACTRLHTLAHACTRLHTLAHACTRLHTLAHACTRLHTVFHSLFDLFLNQIPCPPKPWRRRISPVNSALYTIHPNMNHESIRSPILNSRSALLPAAQREIISSPVPSNISASNETFNQTKTQLEPGNTPQTQPRHSSNTVRTHLETQLNPNETQQTQQNTVQKVFRRKL
jgi:hypothetical protein